MRRIGIGPVVSAFLSNDQLVVRAPGPGSFALNATRGGNLVASAVLVNIDLVATTLLLHCIGIVVATQLIDSDRSTHAAGQLINHSLVIVAILSDLRSVANALLVGVGLVAITQLSHDRRFTSTALSGVGDVVVTILGDGQQILRTSLLRVDLVTTPGLGQKGCFTGTSLLGQQVVPLSGGRTRLQGCHAASGPALLHRCHVGQPQLSDLGSVVIATLLDDRRGALVCAVTEVACTLCD